MSPRIPGHMNLTLAAYYGEKPEHFAEFIRWCQTAVAKEIPGAFRPYDLDQVHATIVGLEGVRRGAEVFNSNYEDLGLQRSMNLKGAMDSLSSSPLLPFPVRIGGFRIHDEYPFTSRGQHPYLRSFALQSSNIVVAMGWPEKDGGFPNRLHDLRRGFNKYNIIHKYHGIDDGFDNDLFFVLGKIDPVRVSDTERQAVSETIRVKMAGIESVPLDVTLEALSVVAYVNDELPVASSVRIPIDEAVAEADEIMALYQGAG